MSDYERGRRDMRDYIAQLLQDSSCTLTDGHLAAGVLGIARVIKGIHINQHNAILDAAVARLSGRCKCGSTLARRHSEGCVPGDCANELKPWEQRLYGH